MPIPNWRIWMESPWEQRDWCFCVPEEASVFGVGLQVKRAAEQVNDVCRGKGNSPGTGGYLLLYALGTETLACAVGVAV